jgi:hypothetical protein
MGNCLTSKQECLHKIHQGICGHLDLLLKWIQYEQFGSQSSYMLALQQLFYDTLNPKP